MSIFKKIFNPSLNTDDTKERSLGFLKIVLQYALIATIVIIPTAIISNRYVTMFASITVLVVVLLCLYLMSRGQLIIASFISLFTFVIITMSTSYLGDGINDISILIIPGILVVAALLLDKKIYLMLAIIAIGSVALVPVLRSYYGIGNLHEDELMQK